MDVEWAKSRLQNFIYEFGDADRCAQWDSDQVMPLLPTVARILEVIGEPVPSYSGLSRHRCGCDLAMRTVEGLVERGFRDTP